MNFPRLQNWLALALSKVSKLGFSFVRCIYLSPKFPPSGIFKQHPSHLHILNIRYAFTWQHDLDQNVLIFGQVSGIKMWKMLFRVGWTSIFYWTLKHCKNWFLKFSFSENSCEIDAFLRSNSNKKGAKFKFKNFIFYDSIIASQPPSYCKRISYSLTNHRKKLVKCWPKTGNTLSNLGFEPEIPDKINVFIMQMSLSLYSQYIFRS